MSPCKILGVLVLAGAAFHASHLRAQETYGGSSLGFLEPGTRVRVTTDDSRETGDLAYVGLAQFEVYVRGEHVPFSYHEVRRIEVSRGRKRGSQTLTVGLGLLGLAVGLVVAANEDWDCSDSLVWCGYPWIIIPPMFAAGGLIVGWGLGQAIVTERWQPLVPVEVGFEGEPRTAIQPRFTLSFRLTL